MDEKKKYEQLITVRFPKAVFDAIKRRIAKKQKKFPRYSEADLIRTAVVKHLKQKELLDKDKDYL